MNYDYYMAPLKTPKTQLVTIEKLTPSVVEEQLSLQPSTGAHFDEWKTNLPELAELEQVRLDRIEATYRRIG